MYRNPIYRQPADGHADVSALGGASHGRPGSQHVAEHALPSYSMVVTSATPRSMHNPLFVNASGDSVYETMADRSSAPRPLYSTADSRPNSVVYEAMGSRPESSLYDAVDSAGPHA